MQSWAKKFGFGQSSDLDIGGEAAGLLPTPAWRKRIGRTAWDKAWNPGDLIQLAIGQKDMNVTPLQMARFYAARERRQPRHAVHRLLDRAAEQRRLTARAAVHLPAGPAAADQRRRGRAQRRPRGPLSGDTRLRGHLFGRLRQLPGAGRRQDRDGREGRQSARATRSGISRISPGGAAGGRSTGKERAPSATARRLRRDRERRPRRHRGRAGRTEGVRALVPGAGRRPCSRD